MQLESLPILIELPLPDFFPFGIGSDSQGPREIDGSVKIDITQKIVFYNKEHHELYVSDFNNVNQAIISRLEDSYIVMWVIPFQNSQIFTKFGYE